MATTTLDKQNATQNPTRRAVRPVGNICEDKDSVMLRLEMPGVSKDGIDVNVDGDTLTIRGERNPYAEGVRYVVHERSNADFRASYTLDQRVDRNKVEAKMENGVLIVTLHLKDEVKPRKIDVQTD